MVSFAGIMAFYWPPKRIFEERRSWKKIVWNCDPIGSLAFIIDATLLIMGLNWAGETYAWRDAHVLSTLVTGAVFLLAFGVYGRSSWYWWFAQHADLGT